MLKQHPARTQTRRAVTLVEVVVSTLLVGFILVSALASVGAATKSWQATSTLADAGDFARQLLTEITVLAYEEPVQTPVFGLESGESTTPVNRLGFDDLDDYKDFTDYPARNRSGSLLSSYSSWLRTADVQKVKTTDRKLLKDSDADQGLRLITVTVTSPTGKVTTLNAYRTTAGGVQQQQGVNETLVTWVGCELQAGSASSASSGVAILNHATDQ